MQLMLFVILSFCVYRVTRFIILDSLIEGVRDTVLRKLLPPPNFAAMIGETHAKPKEPSLLRRKLHELLTCPYCVSIWIAAGATAVADHFYSIPLPLLYWPALSAGSLAVWRYIEDE